MRPRDFTRLDGTQYDVLVIGGGIQGLACAYDAASRGLRVALVEAQDFGAAPPSTIRRPRTAACARSARDDCGTPVSPSGSGVSWRGSPRGSCARSRS